MSKFASKTSVSTDRSKAEIERTLGRYGASQFGYASNSERGVASIEFCAHGRHVRFLLPLPSHDDQDITHTPTGRQRSEQAAYEAWEQACRQRWRALALCVKAKLEAVDSEIVTFEAEFMAHIVLPNRRTVEEMLLPQIEQAYETGKVPSSFAGLLTYED